MPKRVPMSERKMAPVNFTVTTKVREQVERIAQRENVRVSEIGRRAIQEFIQRREER